MVALHIVGVGRRERTTLKSGEVGDPKVGVAVPDMEASPSAQAIKQESAIGRHTRERGALAHPGGVEHHLARTERACLLVERQAVNAIFYFLGTGNGLLVVVHRVAVFEMGARIIKVFAIGRPAGEHLKLVGIVENGRHLVLVGIEEDEVALRVEHLNLVDVARMETLHGLVGGIGQELQRRVPSGINTGRKDAVALHVHLLHLAIILDERTAMVLASMELIAVGVVVLYVVAVDTLPVAVVSRKHVVVDHRLVEVLQATLVDGELLVGDVRWCNETIGNIRVDAVGTDADGKGLVVGPLPLVLGVDVHADIVALGCGGQSLPFVEVGLCLQSTTKDLLVAEAIARNHVLGRCGELHGERCDVHRHRHVGVVGVNGWQLSGLAILRGHLHLAA